MAAEDLERPRRVPRPRPRGPTPRAPSRASGWRARARAPRPPPRPARSRPGRAGSPQRAALALAHAGERGEHVRAARGRLLPVDALERALGAARPADRLRDVADALGDAAVLPEQMRGADGIVGDEPARGGQRRGALARARPCACSASARHSHAVRARRRRRASRGPRRARGGRARPRRRRPTRASARSAATRGVAPRRLERAGAEVVQGAGAACSSATAPSSRSSSAAAAACSSAPLAERHARVGDVAHDLAAEAPMPLAVEREVRRQAVPVALGRWRVVAEQRREVALVEARPEHRGGRTSMRSAGARRVEPRDAPPPRCSRAGRSSPDAAARSRSRRNCGLPPERSAAIATMCGGSGALSVTARPARSDVRGGERRRARAARTCSPARRRSRCRGRAARRRRATAAAAARGRAPRSARADA